MKDLRIDFNEYSPEEIEKIIVDFTFGRSFDSVMQDLEMGDCYDD
jgi:hypothetical protein